MFTNTDGSLPENLHADEEVANFDEEYKADHTVDRYQYPPTYIPTAVLFQSVCCFCNLFLFQPEPKFSIRKKICTLIFFRYCTFGSSSYIR